MTSRQRVLAALNHREPDRVRRDLGGCLTAGINVTACRNLCAYLGITEPIEILLERADLARPAESILGHFKIDTRPMMAGGGYVLAAVHNIQAEAPPENICALWEAANNYGCCAA